MSSWLIGTVAVLYLIAAGSLLAEGKYGLALFAIGCTVANVGLMLTAKS